MKKFYWIGVILLVTSFIFDKLVLHVFNIIKSPVLDYLFKPAVLIESVLSVFFVIAIITESLFFIENKKPSLKLFLALIVTSLITIVLKVLIGRERPNYLSHSFPSGHSGLSFTPIIFLKRFKIFWIIIACYIAISRIYLNQHYSSDVIAGAIIGYGIGDLIKHFKNEK